jgi:defect-in-organelle-trafficking protein DotB
MVLVTGGTGSGKSTLLSSCIRHVIEQENANSKIVTYEAPIEFIYDNIKTPSSIVSQSEVPRHVKSFSSGIESALRRKPDIILIGEARDRETIESSILAAQTGHMLYTTTHTNGVVETIRRLVSVFSSEEQESIVLDLISSIKMIVTQRLVPKITEGRLAIREYLVFTKDVKDQLYKTDYQHIPNKIREIIVNNKTTMVDAAKICLDNNEISDETFQMIKRSYT